MKPSAEKAERGAPRNEDLSVSVKDQIVQILAYGATPVSAVESFLHGEEKRLVRDVIRVYPDLFEVFERGFPQAGPKDLWVRLRRTGDATPARCEPTQS